MLALRTKMRAPPGYHNASDQGSAFPARLSCTHVDAVLKLEEAAHSRSVHIV